MKPLLMGLLAGVVLSGAAGWHLAAGVGSDQNQKAVAGWEPVMVLVSAANVAEEATLGTQDVRTISLPVQFVTGSAVRPEDLASMLGRTVHRPLQPGDLLLWQHFQDTGNREVLSCIQAALPALRSAVETATEAELKILARGAPASPSAPLAPPPTAPDGSAEVLVALRDLAPGERLTQADLESRRAPPALVTRSVLPAGAMPGVLGARLLVSIQAGDVLHWQFLDRAIQPQTAYGCNARLSAQANQVSASVADKQAAAFAETRGVTP